LIVVVGTTMIMISADGLIDLTLGESVTSESGSSLKISISGTVDDSMNSSTESHLIGIGLGSGRASGSRLRPSGRVINRC